MTDLLHFCIGVAVGIMTVALFVFMVKKQDEKWDRMLRGDGDDGGIVH